MISKEEILNKTNGGLDIIKKIYPQVKLNGKFKLRDESEASASIKRDERGIYWIKDFGDGGKAMDAFNLIETKYNCDFKGAVEICAKELNIETNTKIPKETELYFNGKKLIKKEFTKEELNYFGKNITETDLQKFDISSLKAYEGLKSSLKYFIFFYGPFGSLAKINKPQDTSSRFF
jgi:hypothetical protein